MLIVIYKSFAVKFRSSPYILCVVSKEIIYNATAYNSLNARHIVCILIRITFFAPNFHSINLPFQMKINLSEAGIKVEKKYFVE